MELKPRFKFSEPNTPFNQALKPRRREGAGKEGRGSRRPFHLDLVMEVAIGGIKYNNLKAKSRLSEDVFRFGFKREKRKGEKKEIGGKQASKQGKRENKERKEGRREMKGNNDNHFQRNYSENWQNKHKCKWCIGKKKILNLSILCQDLHHPP